MRRRDFIAGLGGSAVAWPLAAGAQQRPAMPVIGYLSGRSAESDVSMLAAVRRGLNEAGYVEGRNLAVEYRFADGQSEREPALFTELTGRHIAVLVLVGSGPGDDRVLRLMRSSQIPIVLATGADLVRVWPHFKLQPPGRQHHGSSNYILSLTAIQLGLLHDLVPNAKAIALLAHSRGAGLEQMKSDAGEAAATLGLQVLFFTAGTEGEIDAAFAAMNQQRADALLVRTSPFFVIRAKQIAALAASHGLPAIYPRREFAEAGGLMSYSDSIAEVFRGLGNYAGRILNGDKPADLPVFRPTRWELVINLKTAKALGLEVPPQLLARADEVIE
jgi:putative tryptophan/tyrosine transport system substrate-binding protein